MGKGTDKLYITHSEWSSSDAFSASAGSGVSKPSADGSAPFKRLPFNFCAISLQPFQTPVCTPNGTIFDIDNILPWLLKHGTNPVNGDPLKADELVKLHFAKNDDGEMVDPVTYKVFTDNTHMVALKPTGNVFAWDTVERLNIKAKNWKDLVSDDEFGRKDIITLQDPQNIEGRNLSSFKYLKDGVSTLTPEQRKERKDSARNVNKSALGNAASVLSTTEPASTKPPPSTTSLTNAPKPPPASSSQPSLPSQPTARHTTGRAAASLTSTSFTPHTSTTSDLAILSTETYLLHPRRVKSPGFVTLHTTLGPLTLTLYPEFAPKAVWNFLTLCKRGFYTGVPFHRNIRHFMIQGGDPTGTGRGGTSCWTRPFDDELEGPRSHSARGVLSMANKGKNTNSSQFFILYRAARHLDRKHTVFGNVVEEEEEEGGSETTLSRLENAPVGKDDRPLGELKIESVTVLVDPFEEFLKQREKEVEREGLREGEEDGKVTWTGKRVGGGGGSGGGGRVGGGPGDGRGGGGGDIGVGKYLKANTHNHSHEPVQNGSEKEEWEAEEQPVRKKMKSSGGFGNFDSW